MHTSGGIGFWFGLGVPLLLAALVFQTITLANGRYGGIFITAFLLTIVADICFIQAFRRGGLAIRCLSILLLLPTVFVVADLIRRAPFLTF